MKAYVRWKNEKMQFEGGTQNHKVGMDTKSPLGQDTAATPKEYVLMGLAGCTAMDVIAYMGKYKLKPEVFEIKADAQTTKNYPQVFETVELEYFFKGAELETEENKSKILEAIRLSQTKYCGVSAMIAKSARIHYTVFVNENSQSIGEGVAQF